MNKQEKIAYVMKEFAKVKLKSSSGNNFTSKEQAAAIAYSEAKKYPKK